METIDEIIGIVTGENRTLGYVLIGLLLVLFAVELYYWVRRYGRIARYRNPRRTAEKPVDGISVVVILTDDFNYLENTVPKIMGQQYPDFELVVVQVSSSPEFADELEMLKVRYPNLSTARLNPDPRFRISNKMIYNVGIKTARYNNIILTTPDAAPISAKWLDTMSKGFANGEVIVAYSGLARGRGLISKLMRCSRLMISIRYIASAVAGRPYRGSLPNLGFTKQVYMENRGFNHLNMTVGEDDLFVQKIARARNTSIVLNRYATVRQEVWEGFSGWWRMRRMRGYTRRYYPAWARRAVTVEVLIRFLFMATVVACGILLPMYTALGALALWIGRLFVVRHQAVRISRRLGERGLATAMMLYDFIEPFTAIALAVSRRIKPPKEVWK